MVELVRPDTSSALPQMPLVSVTTKTSSLTVPDVSAEMLPPAAQFPADEQDGYGCRGQ